MKFNKDQKQSSNFSEGIGPLLPSKALTAKSNVLNKCLLTSAKEYPGSLTGFLSLSRISNLTRQTIPQRYQESSIKTLNIYINWQEGFTWSSSQGAVTSATPRPAELNEGDELSNSLRLTAKKGLGRQGTGHYSRHMVRYRNSLSERILHKEARTCFLKKSKVMD